MPNHTAGQNARQSHLSVILSHIVVASRDCPCNIRYIPQRSASGLGVTKMIVRSSTGKYHSTPGTSTKPWCNINMRATPAREQDARNADHAMFCDKCFSHADDGKWIKAKLDSHYSA
jgi:hypothetical protein